MPIAIVVDIGNLGALVETHEGEVMATLREAALKGAQYAQGLWVRAAQMADIRASGDYIRGITAEGAIRLGPEVIGGDNKDWELTIDIVNTAPHADIVENGHAAFHLPSLIKWGSGRTIRSKKGGYYLRVPFAHTGFANASEREAKGYTTASTKAMMPEHIYDDARQLAFTRRMHQGPILGPQGQFKQADRYAYGGRLDRSAVRPGFIMGGPGVSAGGAGEPGYEERRGPRLMGRDAKGNPLINPAWKTSKFHGMMRSGAPGHAEYTTIRTMTDRSLGWNIPAVGGKFIAMKVASILQNDTRFAEAVLGGLALSALPPESP